MRGARAFWAKSAPVAKRKVRPTSKGFFISGISQERIEGERQDCSREKAMGESGPRNAFRNGNSGTGVIPHPGCIWKECENKRVAGERVGINVKTGEFVGWDEWTERCGE